MPRLDLALLLAGAALLGAGCAGEPVPASAPAAELVGGPLRWMMLPEEQRQARRLVSNRQVVDFLDAFWRRRNPNPGSPINECARVFHERVAAADRLYAEEDRRGSMTDRGRALVLLGAPPVMRYGQRRIPILEPGRTVAAPFLRTRQVAVETWVFPPADLAPELRLRLQVDAPAPAAGAGAAPGGSAAEPSAEPAQVVFLDESPRHASLLEGERLLQLAAQAMVREAPPVNRRSAAPPRKSASHPEG